MEVKFSNQSLKQTCNDPQILEGTSEDGSLTIYVRFNGDALVVRNKNTNAILCSGNPLQFKGAKTIPMEQVQFYIEMYSHFQIKFV